MAELRIIEIERTSHITLSIPKNQISYFLEQFSVFLYENGHEVSCCQDTVNSFVFRHNQEDDGDCLQIEIKESEEAEFIKWLNGFCRSRKLKFSNKTI
jgi:hypothetical protein